MADNIAVTAGAGPDAAAADDIGGVLYQRIKLVHGADGVNAGDVATSNPLPVDASAGELIDAIEALRFAVSSLTKTIGYALPNTAGQPIMEARQATPANLNATVSIAATQTLATVTTVSTVTNQSQIGGFALQDYVPAIMHLQADNLRRNITVT